MPRNARVLLTSGMKGSLKEPSGLVGRPFLRRFLRGREDGIPNDFHPLSRELLASKIVTEDHRCFTVLGQIARLILAVVSLVNHSILSV